LALILNHIAQSITAALVDDHKRTIYQLRREITEPMQITRKHLQKGTMVIRLRNRRPVYEMILRASHE